MPPNSLPAATPSLSLAGLLALVRATADYRRLLAAAATGSRSPAPSIALPRAFLPAAAAALRTDPLLPPEAPRQRVTRAPAGTLEPARPGLLVVAARAEEAKRLRDELAVWSPGGGPVLYYPEPEAMPYERGVVDKASAQERIAVLLQLRLARRGGQPSPLVVTSLRGLLHPTIAPSDLLAGSGILQRGMQVDLVGMLRGWLELGYEPAVVVERPGQFSRRGGIVDVFPPGSDLPVRVELFGDEIDSLRTFDPVTQRSLGPARQAAVSPPGEALPRNAPAAAEALARLDVSSLRPEARAAWQEDLDRLSRGETGSGLDFYTPYFFAERCTLLDHFPGIVLLDGPEALADTATDLQAQAETLRAQLVERGDLPAGFARPALDWEELTASLAGRRVVGIAPPEGPGSDVGAAPLYAGRLKQLLDDCLALARGGARVVVTSHQARRLSALLAERDVVAAPLDSLPQEPPAGSITLVQGSVAEGWATAGLTVLSDAEVFGWVRPRRATRRTRPVRGLLLGELKPGDYVVHIEHGIALFRGLVKRVNDGVEAEYLQLDYAESDRLFVPVEHADRVTRYVGGGESRPTLTRLASADWDHARTKVKRAVQDIARELLALYAAREAAPGYAFGPDTVWQHELESSFPYIETPDQLAAIEDVKADMERQRPMDRLICGDVGYGKTEVALRAAFKAVMDGKQVAILVPTTILAQQHFGTFSERLAAYPVKVEMLSRFRSEKEQHQALAGLLDGTVDMVIGTHRLLQKDVAFKDLGLVIIDEEQRFGVAHKERLKQLRREVDVLTLTATPIPRTMHMGLVGVRDMSTIETPPEDRLPIVNLVHTFDEPLIRDAILRERDRGGQVYFVHNRVHGIESITTRLQRLIPEATFIVGHGQMQEDHLEKVMVDFGEGRFDVLVCTAIIEAGLDIPNVNTILINRANAFGLAQLYQLRGRVGRGANRAYAYFLHDNIYQLSETAERRLDVIRDATELGAGFRVAMRDLEIRGAGNLLGAEQHGHIAAVGFDLYTRLLADAVAELRELGGDLGGDGEEPRATQRAAAPAFATIDLPLDAFLPADYVAGDSERLALYQRMAGIRAESELDALTDELADRFGPPPPAAESLLYLLRVKLRATAGKVASVKVADDAVVVRLGDEALPDRARLTAKLGPALRQTGLHTLRLDRAKLGGRWREALMQLLTMLAAPG